MPPRRATVSAIRRPATAVMLATTTGMVVPEPSDGGQVDVEPRRHIRPARHDEDVVVGQVVRRRFARPETSSLTSLDFPRNCGEIAYSAAQFRDCPQSRRFGALRSALGGHFAAVAAPQRVELLARVVVDAAVGVRAEEVAQGPGSARRAVARCAARRSTTAPSENPGIGMPSWVAVTTTRRQLSMAASIALRKYGATISDGRSGFCVEGLLDPVEELRPDDAAATPDGGQVAGGDAPVVFGAAGLDLVEALRIGDDLRGVQRLADVLGELSRRRWACRRDRPTPVRWSPCAGRPNPTARGRTRPRRCR